MGQYYLAIILGNQPDTDDDEQEVIRYVFSPFGCGSKLMEHSYLDNGFVFKVEQFIGKGGMFYKSRIVWAGDYADKEKMRNTICMLTLIRIVIRNLGMFSHLTTILITATSSITRRKNMLIRSVSPTKSTRFRCLYVREISEVAAITGERTRICAELGRET